MVVVSTEYVQTSIEKILATLSDDEQPRVYDARSYYQWGNLRHIIMLAVPNGLWSDSTMCSLDR